MVYLLFAFLLPYNSSELFKMVAINKRNKSNYFQQETVNERDEDKNEAAAAAEDDNDDHARGDDEKLTEKYLFANIIQHTEQQTIQLV